MAKLSGQQLPEARHAPSEGEIGAVVSPQRLGNLLRVVGLPYPRVYGDRPASALNRPFNLDMAVSEPPSHRGI